MAIQLPDWMRPNQRMMRSPVNPMDKSTIVSIYPRAIKDIKPTIQPKEFSIEAGSYDNPAILVVGPASWWKELDDNQPLLEITNSSIQIADSFVRDYCNGLIECNMGDRMPGLFYVPGCIMNSKNEPDIDKTREWIKTQHKALLDKAVKNQKNWYAALVKLADKDWARTNANPTSVTDDSRLAAIELGLVDKEWIRDTRDMEKVRCMVCGFQNFPTIMVCSNCKAILKPEEFKAANIQFANQG